jgi:hypothetical protein
MDIKQALNHTGERTPTLQDDRMQVYVRGANNQLLEFYRAGKW